MLFIDYEVNQLTMAQVYYLDLSFHTMNWKLVSQFCFYSISLSSALKMLARLLHLKGSRSCHVHSSLPLLLVHVGVKIISVLLVKLKNGKLI